MKKYFFLVISLSLLWSSLSNAALSTKEEMREFLQVDSWAGNPVTKRDLEGHMVLLSFFNPTDPLGVQRTKVLTQWHNKYFADGLRVVGVVTPEFDFEKDPELFREAIKRLKLPFPVGLDSQSFLWRAYNNSSRPVDYFIDGRGRIRYSPPRTEPFEAQEIHLRTILQEIEPDLVKELETYKLPGMPESEIITLGYSKLTRLGNQGPLVSETPRNFTLPADMQQNYFYLSGKWRILEDRIETSKPGASIEIPWDGRPVFVVAGANRETASAVEVLVDGQPFPDKKLKGRNLVRQAGKTYLLVQDYKLYSVLKAIPKENHTLRLIFPNPGIQLFRFIFTSEDISR